MPRENFRIEIDPDRCQGHARCVALAPELFEIDEDGNGRVRGGGSIPDALVERAYLAEGNCPEGAIRITKVES